MNASEVFGERLGPLRVAASEPGGLLDVLGVAAIVLDETGRIALWSPQAHELFGWDAQEALGHAAAKLLVNPALAGINGVPSADHRGRPVHAALPFLDTAHIESAMRRVLETGVPLLDQTAIGRTLGDPAEHAWNVSYYRLEDPAGRVLG